MNYYKPPRRDRIMFADDMFRQGMQQAFSVCTGEFIGYRDYDWMDEPVEQPQQVQTETVNKSQLTLEL